MKLFVGGIVLLGRGFHGVSGASRRENRPPGHSANRASPTYAVACIVFRMAYRAAVVGGSGYTGAELLRLLAGHPEIEVVQVTADSNAGASVSELFPSLGRRVPLARLRAARGRPTSPGSTWCSCALPHGQSQAIAAVARRHRRPHRRPRRRLPPPGCRLRALVRRDAHRARPARAVRVRPPRAVPRRPHRRAARRRARLLPDHRVAGAGAAARATGSWNRPASWSTRCRACPARGAALKATSLFSEANENVTAYGLLTHRHTAEMEHGARARRRRNRCRCCSRPISCR